ncbi:ser/Thr protein phosphatase family [Pyricularia oryzae]|nr:ser/Thr protein phosphatase family [Pyricularia oryzae]
MTRSDRFDNDKQPPADKPQATITSRIKSPHRLRRQHSMAVQSAMGAGLRRRRPVVLIGAVLALLTVYILYTRSYGTAMGRPLPPDMAGEVSSAPVSAPVPPPAQDDQKSGNGDAKPAAESANNPTAPEPEKPAAESANNPPTPEPETPAEEPAPKPPPVEEEVKQKPLAEMSYGTAVRPPFKAMPKFLAELPEDLVPQIPKDGESSDGDSHPRAKRLVIVGDVHGQKTELEALLKKVKFEREQGDHLVLVGDMVNKGPDSAGVIDLAMKLRASAVRGNNEDRVILAHRSMKNKAIPGTNGDDGPGAFGVSAEADVHEEVDKDAPLSFALPEPATDTLEQNPFSHGDQSDRTTVYSLTPSQLNWLSNLPVILRIGTIRESPFTNLVVVHAGLVPGVELKMQDPWAVMNMRTFVYPGREARRQRVKTELHDAEKKRTGNKDAPGPSDEQVDTELANRLREGKEQPDYHDEILLPIEGKDGEPWSSVWAKYQNDKVEDEKERMTVVYGHDASRGLRVPKDAKPGNTFGLDSGCVYGRELTALVIEASEKGVTYETVNVECSKGTDKKRRSSSSSPKDKGRS